MTEEYEMFPAMHGIFMDYLFIVCYGWIVLELIVNIGLKRATFKHTTQNIYAWLIVYYGNLIFMIIHMVYYVVNRIIMFGSFENFLYAHFFSHENGLHLSSKFLSPTHITLPKKMQNYRSSYESNGNTYPEEKLCQVESTILLQQISTI
ncbi:Hypothetical protein CINCED_3A009931 [Cinara cedri]|uniref:Uncharacterized protein n=1 Tax=Cinara cedri TaxID=506608 RepID=A0A5E4NPH0_9HEMI|nr:Hypothetical protein CINCED_3A009931 [Cinara cedri]